MDSLPCSVLIRSISSATRPRAVSQETGTKGSPPRPSVRFPGPPSSQPARIMGREMRVSSYMASWMDSRMGEGAGSLAKGSKPTMRPSRTSAWNAPQWELW